MNSLRQNLNTIIFGTATPAGKAFDLFLISAILLSVAAVALDSMDSINQLYGHILWNIEIAFTVLFSIEYLVRIWISPKPSHYVRSFFGIVDLLSILPTYLALFFPGLNFLITIRILRVLRIFRILRLMQYLSEANILLRSMAMSRRKILVFLFFVMTLTTIYGSLMYIVEGPENGFTSIPKSIYWAIVTLTTVGYGDISPNTPLGQAIASLVMITGYSVIAVPTGIITAELALEMQRARRGFKCPTCNKSGHDSDARFCKHCSARLFT